MSRAVAICGVLMMLCGAPSSFASDVEDLVEAEHRFAEAAATGGIRDAFLGVLSKDGILFRPLPVNGRESLEAAPVTPGVLGWEPVFVEISGNGDLGYTTGPWRYGLDGQPSAFGHYVSIWRLGKGDAWQLMLDVGVSHEEPDASAWEPVISHDEAGDRVKALSKSRRGRVEEELLEADREFLQVAGDKGLTEALRQNAAERIRFYRNGHLPVVGLRAVLDAVKDTPEPQPVNQEAARVARSGDLGYTYGDGRVVQEDESVVGFGYLRIWQPNEDGEWKIVLDLLTAEP